MGTATDFQGCFPPYFLAQHWRTRPVNPGSDFLVELGGSRCERYYGLDRTSHSPEKIGRALVSDDGLPCPATLSSPVGGAARLALPNSLYKQQHHPSNNDEVLDRLHRRPHRHCVPVAVDRRQ
jgi:hypothetical protein